MEIATNIFELLAAIALGLMAGALAAEGAIFVPFWRALPAEAFLAWYKRHAILLLRFFGPLEVSAVLLAIAAAALGWIGGTSGRQLFTASALLSLAVLAVFPIYFQRVNASFADGTIAVADVPEELQRWSNWHWIRTLIAAVAFAIAVIALRAN